MLLVDTNVLSELRKGERADPAVVRWSRQQPITDQHLSVVTVMELQVGYLALLRRDAVAAGRLKDWIDNYILPEFEGRIMAIDLAIATACAALHVPQKKPDADAFIAATALVHNLTVVTRNTRDFEPMGVKLLNPWTAP